MGDRAVVRKGPVVRAAVIGLAVLAAGARAADPKAPARPLPAPEPAAAPVREPLPDRPYRIRAWVRAEPTARLDAASRLALIDGWRALIRRFVGAPWIVEIDDRPGPLSRGRLEALIAKDVAPFAKGEDKLWIFAVEGTTPLGSGYRFSGREYDVQTGRLGPVTAHSAAPEPDAPRALFRLSLDVFAPFAEIGPPGAGDVQVTIQAQALPPANPVGHVAVPGTTLIPLRVFQKPNGAVLRIDPIRYSYLRVKQVGGDESRCDIVSSLPDPLSKRVIGRNRLIALGVKPSAVPTRLRFLTRPPESKPLAGYTLTARNAPQGRPREVGMTDREGRLVLPADHADRLMVYRLLAGNVEPLVEFPAMPGESAEERLIRVNPLNATVALETKLNALKDEVVDLVAVRARLEARLKARADGNAWDEVRTLLDEYKKLPPKSNFAQRLETLRNDAAKLQRETRRPVLTPTAQAQVAEAEALIGRYLDDEMFVAYETAWKESQQLAARQADEAAKKKSAAVFRPTAPPAARPKTAAPPPAAAKPKAKPAQKPAPKAGGGLQPF